MAASKRPKIDPKAQTVEVARRLAIGYPEVICELDHRNAFELLAATILSAQCTDARVNMVTPALFARYPDPWSLAAADVAELENIIRSTGFYGSKARNLMGMARELVDRFDGEVPSDLDDLDHARLRTSGAEVRCHNRAADSWRFSRLRYRGDQSRAITRTIWCRGAGLPGCGADIRRSCRRRN